MSFLVDPYLFLNAGAFGSMSQYLDGTISGNEFVDKSGNGYNADIINNDITTGGFPYKSGALIAQKSSTFGLIPNPNNFWFTSGGTPNQIPVNALFQNVDYGNQIFSRHSPLGLDVNNVEIFEPKVTEIVTYSSALIGASLTGANTYFSVPIEITSNVIWVDGVNGNDTTGTGTKLLPFKTIGKGNTSTSNKTIYVKTANYTESASVFLLSGQTWNFIGYCPLVSSTSPAMSTSGTTGTAVNGAILTPGSGGRGFYFISGNNNTVNRCKVNNNGAFRNLQVLGGTGNVVKDSILINTSGTIHLYASVGFDLIGCYFGGLSSDNSLQFQQSTNETFNIKYNKFSQTLTVGKTLFLFNFAGTYTMLSNTISTTGGSDVQALLNSSAMVGNIYWKYNRITPTNLTSSVIFFPFASNVLNIEVDNNYIKPTGTILNGVVTILGQPSPKVRNNYIETNTAVPCIAISAQSVQGAATIQKNTILTKSDGAAITLGSDADATYDNCYNGSIIEGNKIYGLRYFTPSAVANLGHGIAVFNCIDVKTRYNYVNGANHLVVYKASDRVTAMVNTDAICSYNIGVNNDGSLFPKTMSGVKFYNNTSYTDNDLIILIAGGIYIVATTGAATNNEFKNNIFIDKTSFNASTVLIRIDQVGSLSGFSCDNNVLYSQNNKIADISGTKYTFAQWQALGYDSLSINQNVLLTSTANEKYWPINKIQNALTIVAPNNVGLDISTNYKVGLEETPVIVTKTQILPPQTGAYIQ